MILRNGTMNSITLCCKLKYLCYHKDYFNYNEEKIMVMGRPRELSPDIEETIKLGKHLVNWATEPTEDCRTAWSFWYALEQGLLEKHWKALKKLAEFRPYYEIARAALSKKIHCEELEKGMSHRYIGMYDRELNTFEIDEKVRETEHKATATETAKAKIDDDKPKSHESLEIISQLMQKNKELSDQIKDLQNQKD